MIWGYFSSTSVDDLVKIEDILKALLKGRNDESADERTLQKRC